jgi:hypothetical protein
MVITAAEMCALMAARSFAPTDRDQQIGAHGRADHDQFVTPSRIGGRRGHRRGRHVPQLSKLNER